MSPTSCLRFSSCSQNPATQTQTRSHTQSHTQSHTLTSLLAAAAAEGHTNLLCIPALFKTRRSITYTAGWLCDSRSLVANQASTPQTSLSCCLSIHPPQTIPSTPNRPQLFPHTRSPYGTAPHPPLSPSGCAKDAASTSCSVSGPSSTTRANLQRHGTCALLMVMFGLAVTRSRRE